MTIMGSVDIQFTNFTQLGNGAQETAKTAKETAEAALEEAQNNAGPITDDRIENITPEKPLNVMASGAFKTILVEWRFVNALYIANYEVYASQVEGFTPDASNLVFQGKTSIFTYQAESNQKWYFRVRALNTHGVAGPFSDEAMAQTARVISDDILFGPEVAAELRELSKTADLLADGTLTIEKIRQDALDSINQDATTYTDAEVEAAKQKILGDMNSAVSTKEDKIVRGKTIPVDPVVGQLWLDERSTPSVWRKWTGADWEKLTRNDFSDLTGKVETNQIADKAITDAKIALEAVKGEHIQNNSIGNAKLEIGAITEEKMKWSHHLLF
ncbi:hypothetical protein [Peribacillus simplex]|uniref:hypothetical protein n=1 Tax=Peribacillus simplex TaxID=1478 RepID=UPI00366D72A5